MSDAGLPDPAEVLEVSPVAVARWLELPADRRPRLMDCRQADELAICRIAGSEWFPDWPPTIESLAADAERGVIVYCHHGLRSQRAVRWLRAHGVARSFSLAGGIDAWAITIEPAMARY